ncbi:MAG: hypothetical protein WDA60_11310 [Acidimicrobiia bacterium]|jgi:Flp pilus assembly pilin Flp
MQRSICTTRPHAGRPDRERGANLVEYILLVALIALAVIAAVVFLRGQVSDKFGEAGSKLSSNGGGEHLQLCGAWVARDVRDGAVAGVDPC